jgi:hypothetical protein
MLWAVKVILLSCSQLEEQREYAVKPMSYGQRRKAAGEPGFV